MQVYLEKRLRDSCFLFYLMYSAVFTENCLVIITENKNTCFFLVPQKLLFYKGLKIFRSATKNPEVKFFVKFITEKFLVTRGMLRLSIHMGIVTDNLFTLSP